MDPAEFEENLIMLSKFAAAYQIYSENCRNSCAPDYPVFGELVDELTREPDDPEDGNFDKTFLRFISMILPRIVHWQHVNFLAYYPSGFSYESVLGELLIALLAVNCFSWESCPAAVELEIFLVNKIAKMYNLSEEFSFKSIGGGGITSSASESIFLVMANLKTTSNRRTVVCSDQAHVCVSRAAQILGLKVVRISTSWPKFSMTEESIHDFVDEALMVVCTFGTTATCAVDEIERIGEFCARRNIHLHVDAAYLGNLMLRESLVDLKNVDSVNINLSKWSMVTIDCGMLWVRDLGKFDNFNHRANYFHDGLFSDENADSMQRWNLSFTKRFRSLKLWFVVESIPKKKILANMEHHISAARTFSDFIIRNESLELVPMKIQSGLVCFVFKNKHDHHILVEFLCETLRREFGIFVKSCLAGGRRIVRVCFNSLFKVNVDFLVESFKKAISRVEFLLKKFK